MGRPKKAEPAPEPINTLIHRRVATGATAKDIAIELGMDVKTLKAVYADDLKRGTRLYTDNLVDKLQIALGKGRVGAATTLLKLMKDPDGIAAAAAAAKAGAPPEKGKKAQARVAAEKAAGGVFAPRVVGGTSV